MSLDRPAARANAARNAHREPGRRARWAPTREALWELVAPRLGPTARVAVVGAGDGDDLPLGRIAGTVAAVTLVDIDARTAGRARGRVRRGLRRRVRVIEHDVTGGAADRVVRDAVETDAALRARGDVAPEGTTKTAASPDARGDDLRGPLPGRDGVIVPAVPADPLPGGPYDLVIGDLLYSQLLYPALLDAGVERAVRRATLDRHGAALTREVVARLHASAPVVVHLHDLACWGNGYPQPVELEDVLSAADEHPAAGLALAGRAKGPREADPRGALDEIGVAIAGTRLWRWPFVAGVDYLVVATVAGAADPVGGECPVGSGSARSTAP